MAAGLFALSVNSKQYEGNFAEDLFWGTFYHQHLGEEYGGISVSGSTKRVQIRTCRGLFRPHFEGQLGVFEGTAGIGYCGSCREPFRTEIRGQKVSLCFCGNIINRSQLIGGFENAGHIFERGDDIELLAVLIAQGKTISEGIKRMNQEVEGSYSLFVLTQEGIWLPPSPAGLIILVLNLKNILNRARFFFLGKDGFLLHPHDLRERPLFFQEQTRFVVSFGFTLLFRVQRFWAFRLLW